MRPFRTILFPVDFSQAAKAMVPYVRELAERFNADLTVLNAFNLVRDYPLAPSLEQGFESEVAAIPYVPALQELRQRRQQRLEEFADTEFHTVRHKARTEDGDPAAVIEWVAHREQTDLIVMPTRGLGRFRRLLLGSVTAKVLHDSSCPLLTSAHEPDPALAPASGYRSIVCAVEPNRKQDAALSAARFLARAYGARLCLVHVESATKERSSAGSVSDAFQRVLDADSGKGELEASVRVHYIGVPEGIRRAAIEETADLVVVGRGHEKGAFPHLWSHLYTIIRESPCPVLSV